ncbi:hypothetical protein FTUN_0356 [Frigoriglobus tundricola]|uniref:Uncharacterized protein n=1 Tax=Frigoriglobus tundricola TaxID=2774151 RepID=A0A6M5YFQ5_9BACT|nr:hypothetical protein FTUN_0356 [Frigoriglobus tundricola]
MVAHGDSVPVSLTKRARFGNHATYPLVACVLPELPIMWAEARSQRHRLR